MSLKKRLSNATSRFIVTLYRGLMKISFGLWIANSRRKVQIGGVSHFLLPSLEKDFGVVRQDGIWFHAASVGELESLWPLVLHYASRGSYRLKITGFSLSVAKVLDQRAHSLLERFPQQALIWSFSPFEGSWKRALREFSPQFLVTAKYEAWPDLWFSLSELKVPLVILGAKDRPSLRVAQKLCRLFLVQEPRLLLFPFCHEDQKALAERFLEATVVLSDDPRWEQVLARVRRENERVLFLSQHFSQLPKPWGVLGSAWPEDLETFGVEFFSAPGTLWVFPHSLAEQNQVKMVQQLESLGFLVEKTGPLPALGSQLSVHSSLPEFRSEHLPQGVSQKDAARKVCVFVNEMGILAEFYQLCDWAYVGGGFGQGVHSTIEPAVQGVPIAIGPEKESLFVEIQQLKQIGQVTVLKEQGAASEWFQTIEQRKKSGKAIALCEEWRKQALSKLQATQKITSEVENFLAT